MAVSRKKGRRILESVQGFMFDLDGTLVLSDKSLSGYKLLPYAVEVLTELKERGIPFVTLTNGTAYPVAEQAPNISEFMVVAALRDYTGFARGFLVLDGNIVLDIGPTALVDSDESRLLDATSRPLGDQQSRAEAGQNRPDR